MGMEKRGVRFQVEGREWKLPGLLYVDDLVLCRESEEYQRAMVGHFVEVMVLGGEEGLECEVCVDWIHLEHVSEFNYFLGCV